MTSSNAHSQTLVSMFQFFSRLFSVSNANDKSGKALQSLCLFTDSCSHIYWFFFLLVRSLFTLFGWQMQWIWKMNNRRIAKSSRMHLVLADCLCFLFFYITILDFFRCFYFPVNNSIHQHTIHGEQIRYIRPSVRVSADDVIAITSQPTSCWLVGLRVDERANEFKSANTIEYDKRLITRCTGRWRCGRECGPRYSASGMSEAKIYIIIFI